MSSVTVVDFVRHTRWTETRKERRMSFDDQQCQIAMMYAQRDWSVLMSKAPIIANVVQLIFEAYPRTRKTNGLTRKVIAIMAMREALSPKDATYVHAVDQGIKIAFECLQKAWLDMQIASTNKKSRR